METNLSYTTMYNNTNELTSFEIFCGSTMWNETLSWNTVNGSIPQFTKCFEETIASWVPCGFLLICLPFYLYYLSTLKVDYVQKLTALSATKSILSLILSAVSLFDLGLTVALRFYNDDMTSFKYLPDASYVSAALEFISMIIAAVLTQWYRLKGKFTSGVLWCYWFLWLIGSFIPCYSEVVHAIALSKIEDPIEFTARIVFFILCIVQLILASISDADQETHQKYANICPEHTASFSSYLTFSWFSPVISLGYKKDIERDDLWDLGPSVKSKNHVPAFEADWKLAVEKWRYQKENSERYTKLKKGEGETEPLIEPLREVKEPSLSLVRLIIKHYGGTILIGLLCKFVYDCMQFLCPLLQGELMAFVSSRTGELAADSPIAPVWQGYVFTLLLFADQVVMSFLYQQLWYLNLEVGFRVRASVISMIYKKALRMSAEAKQKSTIGEIVNLMAVDGQRMQDVFMYFWMLFSAPTQIAIALWLLYITIGPCLFVGFGLMVITMPLNAVVAIWQKNIQTEQMRLKDERVKVMTEVLSGIKVIKLYAWEPSFEDKVKAIRREEMKSIASSWICMAIQFSSLAALPVLVAASTYAVYVFVSPEHTLGPTIAFVTLTLFNLLQMPLFQMPLSLTYTVMANVSVSRIVEFFKNTDLSDKNVEKDNECDVSLRITDGTFSWCPNSPKILRNVNLEVPIGSLTAIVGQVGCGKSSLLAACVGDLHKHTGRVVSRGSVAFVAQQAWIQNATVRDNILFGQPFDQKKYNRVIDAVALNPDLVLLDNGDLTIIGEKGINLSGGQKQRVSLARACYSDADLYLLDDPLSAVDAHVGKHIFENVVGPNGLLKGKTRVLVTHGLHWLPEVDNVAVLSSGRVAETGSYKSLLNRKGPFANFVSEFVSSEIPDDVPLIDAITETQFADTVISRPESTTKKGATIDTKKLRKQLSLSAIMSLSLKAEPAPVSTPAVEEQPFVAVEQEDVESGNVTFGVYKLYAKSMGMFWLSATVVSMVVLAMFTVSSSIWLSEWTDDEMFLPATRDQYSDDDRWATTQYYLAIYCGLAILQALGNCGLAVSFSQCSTAASKNLHELLLSRIMKAPMIFFDTKPLGQILNRFSKDVDAIDNILGITVLSMNFILMIVLATIIIIVYSTPLFIILVIPLAMMYYTLQRYFIKTATQLKRWESVTRSPIYTHFNETVAGAESIRAFGVQDRFIQESENKVEENIIFCHTGWAAARWLAIRLQTMSAAVVGLAAAFVVMSTQVSFLEAHISSSIMGLCLSYAFIVTKSLDILARNLTDLETNIVSVERVREYSEIELEADWIEVDNAPPRQWPSQGAITFKGYGTRYRPDLDLVLNDLNFSIKPLEKVGIVGRTGAGKSSMTVALFRLIEAAKGSISIDGINIGDIGLHQLRNKLTILPQDPVLFSGNIRDNLDPFHQHSDAKIWEVLEQSYLKERIERQPEKLEYDCGEGGKNLSVGQRQLVCLARALLRKTKILVLDEATAAVDLETDDLIQKTIRTAFADCTILTIAHRLNTIMDSDRILVLGKGRVAEFDTPKNLLADENSIFSGMAKEAGIKT
ncbi:multidrug resistance-associated protein 1-like [Watersipora subatra]|uniref:multidrug resistance-associated protein 1-like n=1 Tax=Watersipora subatra TaxID=2589382 RepID=UPI00355C4C97